MGKGLLTVGGGIGGAGLLMVLSIGYRIYSFLPTLPPEGWFWVQAFSLECPEQLLQETLPAKKKGFG